MTGVIYDPLCQPKVLAGIDYCFILINWDGQTGGRMDNLCENSDHYRPSLCRPRGSIIALQVAGNKRIFGVCGPASWIKYFHFKIHVLLYIFFMRKTCVEIMITVCWPS